MTTYIHIHIYVSKPIKRRMEILFYINLDLRIKAIIFIRIIQYRKIFIKTHPSICIVIGQKKIVNLDILTRWLSLNNNVNIIKYKKTIHFYRLRLRALLKL